jgi:hypothetical protein
MAALASGDVFAISGSSSFDNGLGASDGIYHFDSEGHIDEDFPVRPAPNFEVRAVVPAPDGKLVLVGTDEWHTASTYPETVFLARIDAADGSLDPTFGGGEGTLDAFVAPAGRSGSSSLASVAPDGSITLASVSWQRAESLSDAVIQRFDANGSPLEEFGDQGQLVVDLGEIDNPVALAPTEHGSWLLADAVGESGSGDPVADEILEIDDQGELVNGFGDAGILDLEHARAPARDGLAVDESGGFLVSSENGVSRFTGDGGVDHAYGGGDGWVGAPWIRAVDAVGLPGGRIARLGATVNRPGAALLVHGNAAGPANVDSDALLDGHDRCPEVPASSASGCPHLSLAIDLAPRPKQAMMYAFAEGAGVCRDHTAWDVVRRRGAKVRRFDLPPDSRFAIPGRGRYKVVAPRRLISDSGICPAARSQVRVIEKTRRFR